MKKYDHKKIEKKWWKKWEKEKIYSAKDFDRKPKYYALVEFPYPSGEGLHTGHVRSYTAMDVVARKRRMDGFNVLYPIGWDAFGLPTENYAIKTGIHPKIVTKKNTDTFRRQLQSLGFSFDWEREINTTDPKYYKWTQWIFLQLYKHGLAYKKKMPINWCLSCKIGLANEEVVDGKCERCGGETEKREKEQWLLAITKYADKLLEDLKKVDYLEKIKIQQANWIGRSEGAEVDFRVIATPSTRGKQSREIAASPRQGGSLQNDIIKIFTTRPDTLFGCTYMVVAPEHKIIKKLESKIENQEELKKYIEQAKRKSDLERIELQKEKTGVELKGVKAINPANNEEIPIWVADYVLASYGTGAIMAVPAHDERDFQFARKYNLPIIEVIKPNGAPALAGQDLTKVRNPEGAYTGDGILINSGQFDGQDSEKAKIEITKFVGGEKEVNYHLRDWIFSRQHYWGEPIPIVFCPKCGEVAVPEEDLPVELPKVKNYEPTDTGESPLAAMTKWVNTKCPQCGGPAERETDTMPNWAGSSWYFLRYIDPKNKKALADPEKLKYWMPVDWYNGGMEHTTLHLLYSRFWNKFLFDIGAIPNSEPYQKRTSQGMVLGAGGEKMSKSKGNVVNPDTIVENFGADTLRLYEMFMGPFDQAIPWDEKNLTGCSRFLARVFLIANTREIKEGVRNKDLERLLHKTIKKVGEDIESMAFNTAVSALMIFTNECYKLKQIPLDIWEKFLVILAPFASFMADELWEKLGKKKSIHLEPWPKFDIKLMKDEEVEVVIQINGKVREKIKVSPDISEAEIKKLVLASAKVKQWLGGQEPKKIIYVKGRLVSIAT
jgi:leucyl-tRNA synthetase